MSNLEWKSEKRLLTDLIPAPYNPRQLTEKQAQDLTNSLTKFNLADPIVINADNKIIGGHQRINILKTQGVTEVDVRVPQRQLNPEEEVELNIRLNKNLGEWDFDALANFDEELLKDIGFNSKELDIIFQLDTRPEEDDIPAAPPPVAHPGDIWQLGPHRLISGDSTKQDTITKLFAGKEADMVFTDPPYNVDYQGGMNAHGQNLRPGIENDKMSSEAFHDFLSDFIKQAMEVCKGAFYICMGNSQIHTLRAAFEQQGGHWQNFIIWVKSHFTITRGDYQHQYEPIMYGWNGKTTNHYFVGMRNLSNVWEDINSIKSTFDGEYTSIKFSGFEIRIKGKAEGTVRKKQMHTDIWRYDKPAKSEQHPTMKPVAMILQAIMNSSHREHIVFDPFLGSGSTMIACERARRICYGAELDPKYCDVIIKRWEEYTKQKATKQGDNRDAT